MPFLCDGKRLKLPNLTAFLRTYIKVNVFSYFTYSHEIISV